MNEYRATILAIFAIAAAICSVHYVIEYENDALVEGQ